MEEDTIRDRIKTKNGIELFRELMRQLPIVNMDDYYKNGVWLDELMKLDIAIVAMHRAVAGAPDALPLEEVKVPEVPPPRPPPLPGLAFMPGVRPIGFAGVNAMGLRPPLTALTAMVGAHPAAPAAVGATADLRQIALFVSKWKLEPTSTKALLARLTPGRRRFVMMNFKETLESCGEGEPIVKLEAYVAHCEKTDAWAGADALMAAGLANMSMLNAKVVAPPGKRPLEGADCGLLAREVRPRPGSPGAVAAGLQALTSAGHLSKAGMPKAPAQPPTMVPPPAPPTR
mmetsp:Transcript_53636/g.141364  ORF Transcript_53636/g.141364 Transcript_53636/m.141364 type:complete len:287 (-) Transcript_53636:35-895(-)